MHFFFIKQLCPFPHACEQMSKNSYVNFIRNRNICACEMGNKNSIQVFLLKNDNLWKILVKNRMRSFTEKLGNFIQKLGSFTQKSENFTQKCGKVNMPKTIPKKVQDLPILM